VRASESGIDLTASTGAARLVEVCAERREVGLGSSRGFSFLELLFALGIMAVLLAVALPSLVGANRTFRLEGSARAISHQLALARMRAASQFTKSRLTANLTAGSYQIEVCTVKGATNCTTFTAEGGAQFLSTSVSFGLGALTTPAGTQTSIAQDSSIIFNSRGIPVDDAGAPTGESVLYLTNGAGAFYAVSVSASGGIGVWRYTGTAWVGI